MAQPVRTASIRIGYPARNLRIGCTPAHTFRLAAFSEDRFRATIEANLACLHATLAFNAEHGLLFFRIGSDLIPFASHAVCIFDWAEMFAAELAALGAFIRAHGMRISMHPGQFTLVNTPDDALFALSRDELVYHVRLLDALGLDTTAKIQVHVGGVYGDRDESLLRFARRFEALPEAVQARLVIENDDRLYSTADCLRLHALTGTPIVFDNLHHLLRNEGEPLAEAFAAARATWRDGHGAPMCDYSTQASGERRGKHAEGLDADDFARFLGTLNGDPCDIMLELKGKETPALDALALLAHRSKR